CDSLINPPSLIAPAAKRPGGKADNSHQSVEGTIRLYTVVNHADQASRGPTAIRNPGMQPLVPYYSFLIFHVAERQCAISVDRVQEIMPMAALVTPPAAPPILAGFLSLGGSAIAVLRLEHLLGLEESPPRLFTSLLLLRGINPASAFMVPRVDQIVTIAEAVIQSVPAGHSFGDCASGIFILEDQPVVILSPDHVLLEKERQCLLSFAAAEQARLREIEKVVA
ncbi:MAG: chemotaxis protein CheW, partial [Phycisphaeraceae bacterium]